MELKAGYLSLLRIGIGQGLGIGQLGHGEDSEKDGKNRDNALKKPTHGLSP